MKKRELAAADAMLEGFTEVSSFTRRFWGPGGMLHRRADTSDTYLITRQPRVPITVARLRPGTGRSSRMDLHMPPHVVSRQDFRRECSDEEMARLRWSSAQQASLVLSVSTKPHELEEARIVGRVLGRLHNRGAFKDATFHAKDS
jgi:hypothetical protein